MAKILTLPLLVVAAACFAESIHVKAKAVIAQHLIARAWHRSLDTGSRTSPWQWADTWPVARLRSPASPRDLYILAGANGGSLAFGPGHVHASALPGHPGTSVIAGHRDTHFRFLQHLGTDDKISLQSMDGQWVEYAVRERRVIDVREQPVWGIADGRDEVHLMTCYPFDAVVAGGPLRLVVIAERVPHVQARAVL